MTLIWAVVEEDGKWRVEKISDILEEARKNGPNKNNLTFCASYEDATQLLKKMHEEQHMKGK
jgi:hypothetical protein